MASSTGSQPLHFADATRSAVRGRHVRISAQRAAAVEIQLVKRQLRRVMATADLENLTARLAELIARIDDARRIGDADAEAFSQLLAGATAILRDRQSIIRLS